MLPDLKKVLLASKMEKVKHSLSNNRYNFTKERTSMNEETIGGLRKVKEHVRISKGPENVIITNSMISSAQNVGKVYKRRLGKQNQEKKESFKLRKKGWRKKTFSKK